LVMFPEGTRQWGKVVEADKMHDGPAFVAARAGVPIVPMGIAGTDHAMPPGTRWIKPVKAVMVVGEPIPAPPVEGRVPRRVVSDLTEQVRRGIQAAYDDALRLRGQPPLEFPN